MNIIRTTAATAVAAAVLVGMGAGGATAASLVTGHDVRDGSIAQVDLANGVRARLVDRTRVADLEDQVGALRGLARVLCQRVTQQDGITPAACDAVAPGH